jgi:hypothetical protein
MKSIYIAACVILIPFFHSHSQNIERNNEAIQKAWTELEGPRSEFEENLKSQLGIEFAVNKLTTDKRVQKNNEFHQFILGNLLFSVDPVKAFEYHKAAYKKNPEDPDFSFEYAIDLHRRQEFAKAAEIYKRFLSHYPDRFDVNVWLADCYINNNKVELAVQSWTHSDFSHNHLDIDLAIHAIYGSDPLIKRDYYLKKLRNGQANALYDLVALSIKWPRTWWQSYPLPDLIESDIAYAVQKFGEEHEVVRISKAFQKIKSLSNPDSIRVILRENNLLIEGGIIPPNGNISSHIVEICLDKKLLDSRDFFQKRGHEVLNLAKELKDERMLNIYTHFELELLGVISRPVAEFGWKKLSDEMSAYDYFLDKDGKLKCDHDELKTAIKDFPNSSILFLLKYYCTQNEPGSKKNILVELIRREFKSLRTDVGRRSYQLSKYFSLLKAEL